MSYTTDWFRLNAATSRPSAEIVLPLVLEHVPVRSALDAGCGTGSWLAVLRQLGVDDVIGVDGDYVDSALLEFPPDRFVPLDLSHRFDLERCFDLAVSLEVAEHLPAAAADDFVASLVRHAPVILFSAAIPGQGGTDHVNEQWPDYWAEKFRMHGYVTVDAIRPRVWTEPQVAVWYAQNVVVYVREGLVPEALQPQVVEDLGSLSIVHPRLFEWFCWLAQPRPVRRRRLLLEATIGPRATDYLRRRIGRSG